MLRPTLPLIVLAVLLAGCGLLPEQQDPTANWSASRFYSEAREALQDGSYALATEYYEKLQARYPFGRHAQQAQLDLIYAYYKGGEPDSATAAADRFIKTHPRHPAVDYAYYMKGLVNFNREITFLDRFIPSDRTRTDTSTARQAFSDFNELLVRFPDSRYAQDATQRMRFLRNTVAAHEIQVADFYMRRGAYLAAANRARHVMENFSRTPSVTDALAIAVEAYMQLGLEDLAADSLRVLQLNHPDSPYIPRLTALVQGREPGGNWFSIFERG